MPVYIFISPCLVFKNNKIYFLSNVNDFTEDFEKNTYYIDFKDIDKYGTFVHKNSTIQYEIITPTENKNLFIHFSYVDEITDINVGEFIYAFQNFIFDIKEDSTTISIDLDKVKYIMQ